MNPQRLPAASLLVAETESLVRLVENVNKAHFKTAFSRKLTSMLALQANINTNSTFYLATKAEQKFYFSETL